MSWNLYEKVQYFKVLDPVWFSDHCPVKMSLSIGLTFDEVPIETKEFIELEQSFQWSEEGSYKFFKALGSERIQKRLLNEVANKCKEGIDPNIAVNNFNSIIYDISKNCLSPKSEFVYKKHEKKCNKWMNKTCFEAKREFEKKEGISQIPK